MEKKTITERIDWKKRNKEAKLLKKQRKQKAILKAVEVSVSENCEQESIASPSTISIAVPGSILENTQSAELRAYVAGQIARAACIFRVNEIVVFDDIGVTSDRNAKLDFKDESENGIDGDGQKACSVRSSSLQLARILQYLECPQYLRKYFFPIHKHLKYCGLLNPLDAPHHLRTQNDFPYREGVVTEKESKEGQCFANVGLYNDVLIKQSIAPGLRITVELEKRNMKKMLGKVVSPDEPRKKLGVYWGYNVRIAHTILEIFTKSPYENGYDLTVGTSDRGSNIYDISSGSLNYDHMLIVFGGLAGLESAIANEENIKIDDPALLFDHYINVMPKQGSRTIRTEEAILVAMSAIQEKLNPKVREVEGNLKHLLPKSDDTGIQSFKRPKLETSDSTDILELKSIRHTSPIKTKQKSEEVDLSRFD